MSRWLFVLLALNACRPAPIVVAPPVASEAAEVVAACKGEAEAPAVASVECLADTCAIYPSVIDDAAFSQPQCAPKATVFTLVSGQGSCTLACPSRHRDGAYMCDRCDVDGDGLALLGSAPAKLRRLELGYFEGEYRSAEDPPTATHLRLLAGKPNRMLVRRGSSVEREVAIEGYVVAVFALEREGKTSIVVRVRVPSHESETTHRGLSLMVIPL